MGKDAHKSNPSIHHSKNEKAFFISSIILLLIAVGVFASLIVSVFDFTVDDAFIFFRYSHNLAEGFGPTYNAAPPRAEGYTSFSWMLLMTIPHFLNIDPLVFSKVFGLLFTLSTFALTFALVTHLVHSDEISLKRLVGAIVVFSLAVFPPTAVHAISGMETSLFTFTLTAFIYAVVRGMDERKFLNYVPLLGLLCGLTRPEGNLIVLLTLLITWIKHPKESRKGFTRNILFAYIIPGSLYFLWRVNYYGLLLPLPFFTKMTKQSGLPGFPVVVDFILAILPVVGIFLLFGLSKIRVKTGLILAAILTLLLLYTYPKHIMGFDWRFLYPTVPLLFSLSGIGIARMLDALSTPITNDVSRRRTVIGLTIGICVIVGVISLTNIEDTLEEKHTYASAMDNTYIPLGEILDAYPHTSSSPTLAITDAGAIPYYSHWRVIDINGYNDPVIAASGEMQPDYILSQEPDVIILVSNRGDRFVHDNQGYVLYFQAFTQAGMGLLGVIEAADDYYLWVLVDLESEVITYLFEVLRR
jgi:hypothetical protein